MDAFCISQGNTDHALDLGSRDTLPLTVVMFVHNEEGVLEDSLAALQTCPKDLWDASFLVISDASTDDSHNIVERFTSLDQAIYAYSKVMNDLANQVNGISIKRC